MSVYFDETVNEADKKAYYKDIKPGDTFTDQLSELLRITHTTQLYYKPSLHLYPLVDRQESGKLFSIYSGKEFELYELLMLDAQVDIKRMEAIAMQSRQVLGRSLRKEEEQNIKNLHPYNCEHVVCQAWFEHKEPMVGDLHHLFTCEEKCNSLRNNYKYFDFPDYRDIIKEDCGKQQGTFFEPEQNKGIAARAVLYFLLRYPGRISIYDTTDVEMLKKWHRSQPATLFELHRNQCISLVQKNRNPFIDHPEWANYIDFSFQPPDLPDYFDHADDSVVMEMRATKSLVGCIENPRPWDENNWRLAAALNALRATINQMAPTRKKGSDGTIGDDIHKLRDSDHNPQIREEATGKGVVTALDITHDPAGKCDCNVLADSLQANQDPRIKYVIWSGRIMNASSVGSTPGWIWRTYTGKNPHTSHIHISVKCDILEYDATDNWNIKVF